MLGVTELGKNVHLVLCRCIETFNWEAVDQKKPPVGKYHGGD